MAEIQDSLLDLIGETPILRLNRLSQAHNCRTPVLAKLECLSPGGSLKDRPALSMLRGALERGELKPGGTVIAVSAGNGGVSLAMACAVMELQCVAVLPDNVAKSRIALLRRYGAEIAFSPGEKGSSGCQELAERLKRERPGAFLPDQFRNEDNAAAHRATGRELLRQVGQIDYFVAGVGSGGTITGCAETIKMECPDCRIIAVEPYASPVLSGGFPGGHPLAGIGPGFIPETLNLYILDEIIKVKTPDSLQLMRELASKEGLLCGPSSGAALSAAILVAQRPEAAGKTVVTVLPDTGERYLEEEGAEKHGTKEH